MKMTQDQFAVFMANLILNTTRYCFDAFYDIKSIIDRKLDNHGTSEPSRDTWYLMQRETGIDLEKSTTSETYQIRYSNNTNVWKLEFCWNCDYFRNEEFCVVTKIKG